ncbi:MAG: CvpA family protein [Candidatus Cloacimonetes bacterium]|nr:CvpA family protein [Candidatus Cloacimonadota bacterium]
MNIIDIVLGFVSIFFFYIGIRKGLIASVMTIFTIMLSFFVIIKIGPILKQSLTEQYDFSPIFSTLAAYVLITATIAVLVALSHILMWKRLRKNKLSWINRLLGGLMGIIIFALIFLMVVLFISRLSEAETIFEFISGSKFINTARSILIRINIFTAAKLTQIAFFSKNIQ